MNNLKEIACTIIKSFLGPNKSNKFILEDKNVLITKCPLHILQFTNFPDPISSLVEETLFAHHELYGCSTLSLLAMWYFWNEEFKLALEDGCDMQSIVQHSQNILEHTISALSGIALSLDKILIPKTNPTLKVAERNAVMSNLNQMPVSIRYSSRHFSPSSQNSLNFDSHNNELDNCAKVDDKCLKTVIQSIDHDENSSVSDLVLECWKKQISFTKCKNFKTDGLLICPITLPCNSCTVVDGLLIKSSCTELQDLTTTNAKRTLIIMGSITYEYVHLGFAPKVSVKWISNTPMLNKKEEWRKKCCDSIKKLNINVLLIKDDVDSELLSFCSTNSVFVFHSITAKTFKLICKALQYSPCTYLWDCKEEDVVKNLSVQKWKPKDQFSCYNDDLYYIFNLSGNCVPLQTLVICHPSQAVLETLEHQMQHLISRLRLASDNGKLLPGGGEVEDWCCKFLRKSQNLSDKIMRIRTALINGFQNYSIAVVEKKTLSAPRHLKILDEMSSKLNAWRSALSLVLLTHQCDTAIINGISDLETNNTHLHMEFYFSDSNLVKDKFLCDLIAKDPDGFVEIEMFKKFNKIRALTNSCEVIACAVARSEMFEVSKDHTKVRRVTPLELTKDFDACTLYVEKLPQNADQKWVRDVLGHFGSIRYVNVPRYKATTKIKGFAFVEFESPESVKSACEFYKISSEKECSASEDDSKNVKNAKKNKHEGNVSDKKDKKSRTRSVSESSDKMTDISSSKCDQDHEVPDKEQDEDHLSSKGKRKRKRGDSYSEVTSKKPKESDSEEPNSSATTFDKKLKSESISVTNESSSIEMKEQTSADEENIAEASNSEMNETKVEDGKRKRKRKNSKKHRPNTEKPALRVMSKLEWKTYRNKYLTLQRTTMSLLKKQIMLETQELKEQESPVKSMEVSEPKKSLQFQPGVILKVKLTEPVKLSTEIKNKVKANVIVAYIDAPEESNEIFIRCHNSEEAQIILKEEKLDQLGKTELLQGLEEKKYWEKIESDRKIKFDNPVPHKKRGRDKILAKAAKLEEMKNKHIYFDE